MLEKIEAKIKRNHPSLSCLMLINGKPIVTTDTLLIESAEKIVGFYNGYVQDWMLEEDFEYFGIDYDAV